MEHPYDRHETRLPDLGPPPLSAQGYPKVTARA
jgi:hypothetical protein